MTEEIKNLAFKGIEKKEQIVLKSFLNLAKNELKYKINVLKSSDTEQQADVLIVSDDYEFSGDEEGLSSLPAIILGDDLGNESPEYITIPIQWSDFRVALGQFSKRSSSVVAKNKEASVEQEADSKESSESPVAKINLDEFAENKTEPSVQEVEQISHSEELLTADDMVVDEPSVQESNLSDDVKFSIEELDEETINNSETDDGFEPINPEYELDNMSIDYASRTNSEYLKVVDDVHDFQDSEQEQPPSAMVLVTDDESSSHNSVLVIETNSLDEWDFSETQSTSSSEAEANAMDEDAVGMMDDVELPKAKPRAKVKAGFDIAEGEKYWEEDNEILADKVSVLYIKHQRQMVYSNKEPGKWLADLDGKHLTKLPLNDNWRPKKGLSPYPVSQLIYVNTLMSETESLVKGLDDNTKYMLEKWPHFDLLQLDNVLLKLCSMLFVKAESLNSLVEKSGYSRSTVRGLMNACYKEGLLKNPDEVQIENLVAAGNDGMFGKIKDVFKH